MKICVGRIAVFIVAATIVSEACADWQVWTVTETARVLRDAPVGQASVAKLASARNEWESFQILVQSDVPIEGIRLEAGDLKGPKGAVLRGDDARLFRQHQFELTTATYRNEKFKPGWYPDALIPFRHPLDQTALLEGRLCAVPFDLPARQTHGFWVDIYVPADTSPGEYRGTYRVAASDGQVVELPILLTVWNFALPNISSLQTAFGSPSAKMKSYYHQRAEEGKEEEPDDWEAVEAQCAELLARHRINATPPARKCYACDTV